MSYTPAPPPTELTVQTVWEEFTKIRDFIDVMAVDYISYRKHHSPPLKPKEGVVYYADGVNWDPGQGEGLYFYIGLGWSLMTNIALSLDGGDATTDYTGLAIIDGGDAATNYTSAIVYDAGGA